MSKYLVIVESPAKVKTISKYLGKDYTVMASMGHVRDLPKSQLGFDPENDYEPKYITIRGKGEVLAKLRKAVKKADKIYLASDPDREGEAISWHLYYALKLEDAKAYRITFNEITQSALKESIKHPREIDMNLVDAQQARRLLDRMVGYGISPLLWTKVKRGLSAGRVQSVTLRMIADREKEIESFIPQEYWTYTVTLKKGSKGKAITASYDGKRELKEKSDVDALKSELAKGKYVVSDQKKSKRERKSPLPFTTSTMQQEAAKALNFAAVKTMKLAQQLYEGVEIKGMGTVALISYLRTDSTRVSDEAYNAAVNFINRNYGKDYQGKKPEGRKGGKIQDAHEAIRPTDLSVTPEKASASLSRDMARLYELIYNRFLASCMSSAVYEVNSLKIKNNEESFSASASNMVFAGYKAVYSECEDADGTGRGKKDRSLPANLSTGDVLECVEELPEQHFTKPKPHFNEASLVKAMEEAGIGRPSTYAPTIQTLSGRHYVTKEEKNLYMTDLGDAVNDIMVSAFPTIVDESFTANMELLLDNIEEGRIEWKSVIRNFYPDLKTAVDKASEELEKVEISDEVTDVICENCGRNMVIKFGPHGKFLACPGFPDCRNTKPYLEKAGVKCPGCGGEVVIRRTKKGRRFFGCENSPECDFISWSAPTGENCPNCGKYMIKKGSKEVCSDPVCGFIIEKAK